MVATLLTRIIKKLAVMLYEWEEVDRESLPYLQRVYRVNLPDVFITIMSQTREL